MIILTYIVRVAMIIGLAISIPLLRAIYLELKEEMRNI
jgi:hypothetical protein